MKKCPDRMQCEELMDIGMDHNSALTEIGNLTDERDNLKLLIDYMQGELDIRRQSNLESDSANEEIAIVRLRTLLLEGIALVDAMVKTVVETAKTSK